MGMALPLVRMPLPAVYSSRILAPPPGLETSLNLTEDDPIMTITLNARLKSCAISTSRNGLRPPSPGSST
jgi:hypothetical protein